MERKPNPDEVICPNCTHQFRAIPENVQAQLAEKERGVQAVPAAPVAESAEPLSTNYIQTVPDKCDRIVWRTRYYHLPIKSEAEAERIGIRKGLEMAAEQCNRITEEQAKSRDVCSMRKQHRTADAFNGGVAAAGTCQEAIRALLDAQKEGV